MKKHTPIAVGMTLNRKCERLTICVCYGIQWRTASMCLSVITTNRLHSERL
jgi:hypothetical protein